MDLDENLAAVHAYLCSDGYVIRNPEKQKHKYFNIGLRNTNLELLKDFQQRFEKVFGIKPHLVIGQRCRLGSKRIYEVLTKEFGSFYSWTWKMPDLNEELSKIWLRTYFDCDGWVACQTHKNRHIGLDSVNEKGINQIKLALSRLGIHSKVNKRTNREIFSLYIYGKENITKFKEQIGFLHPNKKQKLEQAIKDFVNYNWIYPDNKEELIKFVNKTILIKSKVKGGNGIVRIISNKEENLTRLQKELVRIHSIESKVNKRTNGMGTIYFELNINKQEQIRILIDKNLLRKEEENKWKSIKLMK